LALLLLERDLDLDLELVTDFDLEFDLEYVLTEAADACNEFENFSIMALALLYLDILDFELDFLDPDLLVLLDFDLFYPSALASSGPSKKCSWSIL
jgi:hypothetical protein